MSPVNQASGPLAVGRGGCSSIRVPSGGTWVRRAAVVRSVVGAAGAPAGVLGRDPWPRWRSLSGERTALEGRACLVSQGLQESVLERVVGDRVVGSAAFAVVPVPAARERRGVVAGGEPLLRLVAEIEVVGRPGAAHPGRHPAGVDGVA